MCSFFSTNGAENFNSGYESAIKAFIIILSKMFMRKGAVTYEFVKDLYEKVDIESFINQ